jgi:tetratricopeptide (TPR) repeat protein
MDASTWMRKDQQYWKDEAGDEALEAYQRTLALDPNNAKAHKELGDIFYELDELDQAEAHYRAALQLTPNDAATRIALGQLYKTQDRPQAAQSELERVLQLTNDRQAIKKARALLKELSGLDYIKCSQCGNISTLGRFYQSSRKRRFCPRCYLASQSKRTLLGFGLVALAFLALDVLVGQSAEITYYHLVNVAQIVSFAYLMMIPHELAHASMARLLNGQVFEIRVGLGPVAWQRSLGGVHISVARYPIAGYTALAYGTRRWVRVRYFLAVAAGPLFSALLLLLLVPGYRASHLDSTYAVRESLIIVNALILCVNLFPRRVNLAGVPSFNDGGHLWQIMTGQQTADLIHLAFFLLKGAYALEENDYTRAVQVSQAGLALYPDSTLLKNVQAVALLEMGQHAEALALFQELLVSFQREETQDTGITDDNREFMRAILLNNIAHTMVLAGPKPEGVQQAHDYARQAFQMLPWLAPVQGTWGSVLVQMGRAQEGIEHLLEACAHNERKKHKASNLAHAALGYQQLGDVEKAAAMLNNALALDASDYVVQKVKTELQGIDVQKPGQ